MSESSVLASVEAGKRFQSARRKLFWENIFSLVRGRSPDLLAFEEVQTALGAWQQVEGRVAENIPLDKVVGSVGRYRDFTRAFLPKESVSESRWRGVDAAMHSQAGLPPIEVYQVGDIYFVKDGNHRVSVARANGFEDIEAYVTRVETPVRLDANTRPEDLVLKAAYADFLRATHLDELRPDLDLEVTEMYSYTELLEHIAVHRHYMGLEQGREIANDEAVQSWYDRVYLPVAAAVWASDILERFPGRTPADLYIWVCRHREALADDQGVVPSPVATVADMTQMDEGASPRVVGSVKRAIAGKPKAVDLAAEAARAVQEDSSRSAEDQPLDAADG
ncbi:MAG: hypothetical protein R2844_20170 [Caldilineales bacterium]